MAHHQSRPAEPQQPSPREVELKFTVPDTSAKDLAEQLWPRISGRSRRHEVTTYFDTPDHTLAKRGMTLRVRAADGTGVQTLKADRRQGVAADRAEWEWPVRNADAEPDPRLLEQTPLAHDLPQPLDLEPIFRTEIDRTQGVIALDETTVVDIAFDRGLITAGEARQPVGELELELRTGHAASLYRLALQLHGAVPLMLEADSKATRGHRLKYGLKPQARKSTALPPEPGTTTADALRRIVSDQLGHLLANQPAALAGNPEGVHQMRVAIRRLRAALALFQPHLEPHAAALFQSALQRVGRSFGEARDWDVFCLQILPDALGAEPDAGWRDLLLQPAEAARTAAHRRFAEEVRKPAFTALVLGLAAWAEDNSLLSHPVRRRPIEEVCPGLLDRLAKKVAHRGRHIAHRSDLERHALRKSLKKLRYGIDFMRPMFPPGPLGWYLHDCKKLQRSLGDINDAVTATALATGLAEADRPGLAPAVGALAQQLGRRHEQALRHLAKRWKALSARPPFWT
jgi:triphosphatase